MTAPSQKRFLQLPDVAEILDISMSQVLALVHRKELLAIKIGGRGQYRVEISELEAFIQRCYAEADRRPATGAGSRTNDRRDVDERD